MLNRLIPLALLSAILAAAPQAHADDDHLDRLRDAVSRGEVMPLSKLQDEVRRAFPGEIIKVELDEDDDRFIYEFKVLKANGRLVEIEMDAKDGRVLDVDTDDDDD
ncbi:Peptidase propeptide and YPEB domain-containing protein [Rhizobium sp. NFR07]|uniref:PepSY domain-containing protein n=1 Tax=Rhizobium sp. NFR07 TaxID=1566262 RepID=UPI0008F2BFD5|nr:PepSY domain-containing protein [Rhizobium sp. NFR07]SFB46570.1 Peptidase propeptide and YPEB domain-containing protein [Rhizobium sp. NFR07]